jgi:protein-S-isoprenylcysteine O-methyltransferase Ste14
MVSKRKRLLQRFRVPLGFLISAAFIFFARPTPLSLAAGGATALVGLFIRAWAAGHIHKYEKLAVSGPYSFTRNPLYLGSFFLAIGFTVAAGVWWLAIIAGGLFLGIYLPVMRVEEQDLRERFSGEFDDFARNVPLFLPRLTPWKKTRASFDFQLYLKHREYQAAIGLVAGIVLLALKMVYLPGY